ncbi:hypothetical protein [Actinokineospora sp. UTMC 2448]|uniref:hypothetical protein n=1 Tax=Actinokineospora sp. UTMC 2448 TaxID=2268449 RepID=UPI0021647053|nr:hypothetical protein [Actinokineospora sp. UTMC 2448]
MAAVEGLTPFQRALEARREQYNARFRMARHRNRSLSPADVLAHLHTRVGPVVAAAGGDPVEVTDALVELSFAAAERDALSSPVFDVLPALAGFVGAAPRRVPAAVLNAALHLADADLAGWLRTLGTLGRLIAPSAPDRLLAAGAVAAWRHGLARLRASALAAAAELAPDLRAVALGVSSPVSDAALAALAADPWAEPNARGAVAVRAVRRVGAFTGFGGRFRRPPVVHAVGGRWFAVADQTWELVADRFGAALLPVPGLPPGPPGVPELSLRPGGLVVDDAGPGGALALPELASATSVAGHGGTLAVTTAYSHAVVFVARTT